MSIRPPAFGGLDVATVSGGAFHEGYVIAGHWLTVYRVERWAKEALR